MTQEHKELLLKDLSEEENKEDLCNTCENYWIDFSLPLEQVESHCTVIDEKVEFGKMDEVVPYPCFKCPFNCYSKKK